jgi:hypothetical protein
MTVRVKPIKITVIKSQTLAKVESGMTKKEQRQQPVEEVGVSTAVAGTSSSVSGLSSVI